MGNFGVVRAAMNAEQRETGRWLERQFGKPDYEQLHVDDSVSWSWRTESGFTRNAVILRHGGVTS